MADYLNTFVGFFNFFLRRIFLVCIRLNWCVVGSLSDPLSALDTVGERPSVVWYTCRNEWVFIVFSWFRTPVPEMFFGRPWGFSERGISQAGRWLFFLHVRGCSGRKGALRTVSRTRPVPRRLRRNYWSLPRHWKDSKMYILFIWRGWQELPIPGIIRNTYICGFFCSGALF